MGRIYSSLYCLHRRKALSLSEKDEKSSRNAIRKICYEKTKKCVLYGK